MSTCRSRQAASRTCSTSRCWLWPHTGGTASGPVAPPTSDRSHWVWRWRSSRHHGRWQSSFWSRSAWDEYDCSGNVARPFDGRPVSRRRARRLPGSEPAVYHRVAVGLVQRRVRAVRQGPGAAGPGHRLADAVRTPWRRLDCGLHAARGVLVALLLLAAFVGTYPLLRPATFMLPSIAYFFAARSQTNYLIPFIPVGLVAAVTAGPRRSHARAAGRLALRRESCATAVGAGL